MTLEEKLQTMEILWDDLCRRERDMPMPLWQKNLLDEREILVDQGKARFMDWEAAKKHISTRTS
jgi:hypothetical protein